MEINRDVYLERLIVRKHNGFIKVITGIRRCGKSYLLNTLFYNHLKVKIYQKIILLNLLLIQHRI
jgi:predicted AAA+ superfamily ATPase